VDLLVYTIFIPINLKEINLCLDVDINKITFKRKGKGDYI